MLMLKAYVDDSNMGQGPIAILSGWLAPARTWAAFAADWDDVLRMSPRIGYFKWHEYRAGKGEFTGISGELAQEKVKLLVGLIEQHEIVGTSSIISNEIHNHVFGTNEDKFIRSPYFLAFYTVVAQFARYAADQYHGQKIDFIFDIQPGQMEAAVGSWEHMKEIGSDGLAKAIGNVSFHDDKDVLPLQAADLSAGWTREQAEAFHSGQPPPEAPWGNTGSKIMTSNRTWTVQEYLGMLNEMGALKIETIDPASQE